MSSQATKGNKKRAKEGEVGVIPFHLLKNLRSSREGAESGSSNGEGNSDNSALVSIGNTSFGFNFDSESSNNSDRDRNENSEDSGDDQRGKQSLEDLKPRLQATETSNHVGVVTSASSKTTSNTASVAPDTLASTAAAQTATSPDLHSKLRFNSTTAANAVAYLQNLVNSGGFQLVNKHAFQSDPAVKATDNTKRQKSPFEEENDLDDEDDEKMFASSNGPVSERRKLDEGDSSVGYHTDDEGRSVLLQSGASSVHGDEDENNKGGRGKKKRRIDEKKREERNLREKERSLRISKQIDELRTLLSSGGVIVPKGTKSSVLTEAANYIRLLQNHQYKYELDRYQLVQQMQLIGNGAHGSQAAAAIRHAAAQNGIWSLGNFGGAPPKSAMSFYDPSNTDPAAVSDETTATSALAQPTRILPSEYKFIFNSCGVGMAVASLGGAFIDCNQLFCQLSNYSKEEVCGLTIFNLTARQDLQHAFDLISRMISPQFDAQNPGSKEIVLRGAMKNRDDVGMCISLIKGDDGIAKYFCTTLIKNPTSPFDTAKPIPLSFDALHAHDNRAQDVQQTKANLNGFTPAFTLG